MKNQEHKIHVASTFHHDIAYLKSCGDYLPRCYEIINRALELMEEDEGYHFAIEQVFLWRAYWEAFPEKRATLKKRAKEGRLTAAPGLYAVPDTNMTDGESMFMQAYFGKIWLDENLDMNPTNCLIADCWGHHAQLPQIMSQCGYEFYMFMRCIRPETREIGENFIWEGLDGTVIKTHWLRDGYAGIRFPTTTLSPNEDEMSWLGLDIDRLKKEVVARYAFNKDDCMLIPNGGDMQMPQYSAPEAMKFLNENGLDAAFSSFEKYLNSVNWDGKQVVSGDFNTAFQGTFTTNIKIKQYNTRLTFKTLSLESIAVMLGKQIDVTAVWETILKGQFHDTICGTLCDKALADTLEEYAAAEQTLNQKIYMLNEKSGGVSVVNPLGFARTEVVSYNGKNFLVSDIPPMSAVPLTEAFELKEAVTPRSLPCAFENPYYTAQIGEDGYIATLLEKSTGCDLNARRICNDKPIGFGEIYMQDDYGDNWYNHFALARPDMDVLQTYNYPDPYDRGKLEVYPHNRPISMRVNSAKVISDTGGQLVIEQRGETQFWITKAEIVTTMTLSAHEPLIRYKTELLTCGKHMRFKVVFPVKTKQNGGGRVIHEIPFGWVERGRSEFAAMGFIDYAGDDAGLAVFNIGQPGNIVDEDGNMMLSLHRAVAMEYKTQSNASFQEGVPQSFEYAILPHGKETGPAQLCKASNAYRQPPLLINLTEPVNHGGFALSSENALISSVRVTKDGIFVRVFETAGCAADISLKLPGWVHQTAEADGLMRPAGAWTSCKSELRYTLKPHEIKGWLFK